MSGTTDTFSNARGQTFIAGQEVPSVSYWRHVDAIERADRLESLVARLLQMEVRGRPRNLSVIPEDGEILRRLVADGKVII